MYFLYNLFIVKIPNVDLEFAGRIEVRMMIEYLPSSVEGF
jgi:hypothetical protein